MRLVIDVDGVLADAASHLLDAVNDGRNNPIQHKDITAWDYRINGRNFGDMIEDMLHDPEFNLSIPVIPGAVAATNELAERGHAITIATNRHADIDTESWLTRKGIPFDHFISTRDIGSKQDVPGALIVDDYPRNVIEYTDTKRKVGFLFSQPWNRKSEAVELAIEKGHRIYRADSWSDVVRLVKQHEWEFGFRT